MSYLQNSNMEGVVAIPVSFTVAPKLTAPLIKYSFKSSPCGRGSRPIQIVGVDEEEEEEM